MNDEKSMATGTQSAPKQRHATGFLKFLLAMLWGGAAFFLSTVVASVLYYLGVIEWDFYGTTVAVDLSMAVIAAVGLVVLGGWRLLRPSLRAIGEAFDDAWALLAMLVGYMLYLFVICLIADEIDPADNWLSMTLALAGTCLCIGLAEEFVFRGLLLEGLLSLLGRGRVGVVASALLASLVFGLAHVTSDFGGLMSGDYGWMYGAQMLLKTLQTFLIGFLFCATVLKTRNLLGVSIVHGLYDFGSLFISAVLLSYDLDASTEYVSTGSDMLFSVIQYGVLCLLELPLAIRAARILREIEVPERGALYRDFAPSLPATAPVAPAGYVADTAVASAAPGAPVVPDGYSSMQSSTGQWSEPNTSLNMDAPVTFDAMSSDTRK